jgi:vitamin B12 transporter
MQCFFIAAGAVLPSANGAAFADEPVGLPEETVTGESIFEDKLLLSPGSVTVVKPEEMKGEQKDLPELLKRVPGLHVIEARGRGAYTVATVRGSTAAQVSVFVDGVQMNLASEAAVDLSTIPVENVERIEVYRGYIPARFAGASIGGVINIITKKPQESGGELSAGIASFNSKTFGFSYHTPFAGGKLLVGANYDKSDGNFEYWNDAGTQWNTADDYKAKRQNNAHEDSDVLLKWDNGKWNARASWKKKNRDLPYAASNADRPDSKGGTRLKNEQTVISLGRRYDTSSVSWGWKADWLHQEKVFEDPNNLLGGGGEYRNEYETDRIGLAADAAIAVGDRHLIEIFADYANEELDIEGDVLKSIQTAIDAPISSFRRESFNIQLQDTIALDKSGSFWFTPMVRYNRCDGEDFFSWGVALAKRINENWLIKATGGTYNRAPNLYEKYGDGAVIRPNLDLAWEEGTQWDVGVEYTGKIKSADVYLSAAVYGRHADNLIEFLMMTPRYGRYENIGKADVYGVELEGNVKLNRLNLYGSATYTASENKSDNYKNGFMLPNRPKYEALFRANYAFPGDKVDLFTELHYCGDNYFDDAENVQIDDFFTADFGLRWRINENLKLTLGVDDAFNGTKDLKLRATVAGPERMLWYPLQGRTFYATLTWTF